MERPTLSGHAIFCLIALFCLGNASILGALPIRDSWASLLLGAVFTLPLLLCLFYLTKGCASFDQVFARFSPGIRWFFQIIWGLFALFSTVLSLRIALCFLSESSLPLTSPRVLTFLLILVLLMFQRSGLFPTARAVQMLFPIILMILFLSLIISLPQCDWGHLLPALQSPREIGAYAVSAMFFPYSELAFPLLLFLPLTASPHTSRKAAVGGCFLAAGLLAVIFCKNLCILGLNALGTYYFPSYAVAGLVSLGNFFQRFEIFLLAFYLLSRFCKTAITFSFACESLCPFFHLSSRRMALLLTPLLFFAPLYLFSSSESLFTFLRAYPAQYGWLLPVLIMLTAAALFAFGKKEKGRSGSF